MVETSVIRPRVEQVPTTLRQSTTRPERFRVSEKRESERPRVGIDKHGLDALKENKSKKPAPLLWRERAVFLPETANFFRNCGINPQYVNPSPIGEGLTNVVFEYRTPDGSERVIKVAKQLPKGFMSTGYEQDNENIDLVKKYFGPYAVPTDIRRDGKTGRYLIVQDRVRGKVLTNKLETQAVRSQLVDLARLNREMMRQTGHSLDFIGIPGFLTWLRHQYRAIITQKSEFEVSNIVIERDGSLKIIDETLLRFRDVPVKQRVISNIGFLTNRLIMRLYFGVDLQPDIES